MRWLGTNDQQIDVVMIFMMNPCYQFRPFYYGNSLSDHAHSLSQTKTTTRDISGVEHIDPVQAHTSRRMNLSRTRGWGIRTQTAYGWGPSINVLTSP